MQSLAAGQHDDDDLTSATIAEFTTGIAGLNTDFEAYHMHSMLSHTRLGHASNAEVLSVPEMSRASS